MTRMFEKIPVEAIYTALAIAGGVARYLNGYVNGQGFKFSVFAASAFVAGFSGLMFAILGDSLNLPNAIVHVMAGTGGFMGDQTLKFVMEYVTGKVQSTTK